MTNERASEGDRGGARVALAIISGLVALLGVLYVLAAIVLVSAVD